MNDGTGGDDSAVPNLDRAPHRSLNDAVLQYGGSDTDLHGIIVSSDDRSVPDLGSLIDGDLPNDEEAGGQEDGCIDLRFLIPIIDISDTPLRLMGTGALKKSYG